MSGRPLWTEAIILLLSIFGFASIFSRRRDTRGDRPFLRFLALYTLLLSLLYMIIPYKTPWSMLGFYHGFILVAAVGADEIFSLAKSTAGKWAVASLLTAALLHLGWQTVELNFKYDADISNPYVYAHTDPDIFLLTGAIKDITKYSPDGKSTYIEVVCPNADYWPLPWYLRRYNNVGYFAEFDNSLPAGDLIVTMPALETSLLKKLEEELAARGATEFCLEVRVDNTPALHLYEKFGYERVGLLKDYYGPGRHGYFMRKGLSLCEPEGSTSLKQP